MRPGTRAFLEDDRGVAGLRVIGVIEYPCDHARGAIHLHRERRIVDRDLHHYIRRIQVRGLYHPRRIQPPGGEVQRHVPILVGGVIRRHGSTGASYDGRAIRCAHFITGARRTAH